MAIALHGFQQHHEIFVIWLCWGLFLLSTSTANSRKIKRLHACGAEFSTLGLTRQQFTARLDGLPIPMSEYLERKFYYYGANTSSSTFTTHLTDNERNFCGPVCNSTRQDELEMILWINEGGVGLDWWLMNVSKDGQNTQLLTRCPREDTGHKGGDCGYRKDHLYVVRKCLEKEYDFRLTFYNEFAHTLNESPKSDMPQIDVKYNNTTIGRFQNFKTKSLAFGSSVKCQEGSLFQLIAHQYNEHYNHVPSTAYKLSKMTSFNETQGVLNGSIAEADANHYAWTCVDEDACMKFSMERDLEADEDDYRVQIFLSVDGAIYRDTYERWDLVDAPCYSSCHAKYSEYNLIGHACNPTDHCQSDEVLLEMELDIREERSDLNIQWEVNHFTEGQHSSIDELVRDGEIFGYSDLVDDRTYRYHHCLPARNCYVFSISGSLDSLYEENSHKEQSVKEELKSRIQLSVDQTTILNRSIPLMLPFQSDPFYIGLTGACLEDDHLSAGQVAAVVIGSTVGLVIFLLLARKALKWVEAQDEDNRHYDNDNTGST